MLALALACRDDVPVAPSQPLTVNPVVRVIVSAGRQSLAPGDSVRASAQALDAQGLVLPTASITWASSAPSVATVDARGMVRAVAVGTAQIRATADGQTGSLDFAISVTELCDCTRILDSTKVQLVQRNDSTGVFVFRVVAGQAPAIDSGSIIVGAENGGFLRRVHRIERADNTLTLQTTQAYLEEAIRIGDFASTSFTQGETELINEEATEAARWGPWMVTYLDPNVKLAATSASLSLDGVTISWLPSLVFDIKDGRKAKISAEIIINKGEVVFEPRMQISGAIDNHRLQRFRTVFTGGIDLNIDEYEARVEIEGGYENKWQLIPSKKKRRMARAVKPFSFFIGPVPVVGIINKEISLQVTPSVAVSGTFTGLFKTGFEVSAGAEWNRNGGWRPVSGSSSYLDATWPELKDATGSAAVKIAVVPEISVLFYGVGGPFVNLEPYAQAEVEAVLSRDAGRTTGLDWETKVALGLNTNIGAKLSIFGIADLLEVGFAIPIVKPYTLVRGFSDGDLLVDSRVTGQDRPDSLAIRLRPAFQDRWELGPLGLIATTGSPVFGRSLATSSQDTVVALGPDTTQHPPDTTVGRSIVTLGETVSANTLNECRPLQGRCLGIRSGRHFPHTIKLHDLPGNCAAADSSSDTVAVRSRAFMRVFGQPQSQAAFYVNCIPMGALKVHTVVTGQEPVARSRLTLTRRDTAGSGKGTPPLSLTIPGGAAPADTIIAKLAPANPALGTHGRHDIALDPGRRNCAVAKPTTHQVTITSGDTAQVEFRLTCVALGYVVVTTKTTDPDSAPPSDPVTYAPNITARDTADRVTTQPLPVGATASSVGSGLIPLYNASGASGRHDVRLTGAPNRCAHVGPPLQSVTIFPGDTATTPFVMRCVERLHVSTRSTGVGSDRDGYIAIVENADGSADSVAIAINDTLGIAGVTPGSHTIRLADVDPNCNAPASVTRNVSGRDSTLVSFTVHCPGPPAPTGLRTTLVETTRIDLAWDPPPAGRTVAFYRLYRGVAPAASTLIDSTTTLAFSDNGLTPFTRYTYQVAAVDANGVAGPRSSLTVRTRDATPPSAANLTAAAVNATRINLSWSAAVDPETGVNRYRIYRNGTLIDSTAATSYGNQGLVPNTTYTYHVIAVNGEGLSGPPSNSASATTPDGSPPSAPSGLSATAMSMSRIDLTWTAAVDPNTGIAHYKVYRNGAFVATSSSLAFSDQGLTPNTTYTYAVTAVNGAGLEGPPSQPASATTLPDQTPPTAPSNLSANAVSSTQINLAWSAATDPESGIASYRVYRGGTLVGTATTTTFSDTGLAPSTTYSYEVSAVNGAGIEGARAGPASATTHAPPQTGDLTVNVVSVGTGIPAGGYQAQVSAGTVLRTQPVGPTGSTTFMALVPQTYSVTMLLPSNCVVDDGPNPRSVVVVGGGTVGVSIRVRCN
jgi:chitodextrinase